MEYGRTWSLQSPWECCAGWKAEGTCLGFRADTPTPVLPWGPPGYPASLLSKLTAPSHIHNIQSSPHKQVLGAEVPRDY